MKKLFTLFLPLLLLFASCSKEKKEGAFFRINTHSEPSSLDPRLVRDIPTVMTSKMLFDGLTRPTLDGKIAFSLAERVEISPDKKSYHFFLKKTFWSSGLAVTAHDFEYAWKSTLSPDTPSEYAHQLFGIKNAKLAKLGKISLEKVGVKALNDQELLVDLEYPDPFFLELVSSPISYPVCRDVAEKNSLWASAQGKNFICNGPFRLVNWTSGSELIVEKNPTYWDREAVKLDGVIVTHIEDEHTELNMYENGELDWAGSPNSSIPPEALPSYKKNEELHILPLAGTFCYKFNTRKAPFDSVKMRKAFSSAINRKSLVENILQANQIVAHALLPPCLRQKEEKLSPLYDEESATALTLFEEALKERGWTRESMPPITLIFSKSEKHQKIAQEVQQEWNKLFQIKIQLQSYEWNTYLHHLATGDYQVGGKGWISDLSDPKTLLEFYAFEDRDTGWENKEFTQLIEEAKESVDPKRRTEYLDLAEEILLNEMPIAPLYHSTACYLKKPYVKDVYISKLCDIDFKHASIRR